VVNNAESTPLTAALQITGFTHSSARLWRLSADSYAADNDRNPTNVVLREEPAQVPLTELSLFFAPTAVLLIPRVWLAIGVEPLGGSWCQGDRLKPRLQQA